MKDRIAILRNVALVSIASYLEAALGLVVGVVIARSLGPADFGHYAFAVWVCGWLILAGNNALTTSSIKFIAEARGAGQQAVAAALAQRLRRLQWASLAVVLSAFLAAVAINPPQEWNDELWLVIPLAIVAVLARANFWLLGAIGKGYERFEPENIALAATALVNLALVVSLTLRGGSVVGYLALYAVSGLVANGIVRLGLRRYQIKPAAGAIPPAVAVRFRRHLMLTAILMLLGLMTNRTVEMLLLRAYAESAVVGFFAIAGTLTKGAVDLLAGGMAAVLLPAMARAYGRGSQSSLAHMLSESTRFYWFVGLAIAGGGVVVAEGAIHLLYGARFEPAIGAVMWSLVIAGIVVVNGAAAAVLTAGDRQADRIGITVVALLINVAAGFALIPRFGLNGAIASLALTQFVELVFAWWFAQKRTQVRLPWRPMLRTAIAAACATAAGAAVSELVHLKLAFVAGGMVFLAVYLPMTIWLRAWRATDFDLFANVLRRLGRPGSALADGTLQLKARYALPE